MAETTTTCCPFMTVPVMEQNPLNPRAPHPRVLASPCVGVACQLWAADRGRCGIISIAESLSTLAAKRLFPEGA